MQEEIIMWHNTGLKKMVEALESLKVKNITRKKIMMANLDTTDFQYIQDEIALSDEFTALVYSVEARYTNSTHQADFVLVAKKQSDGYHTFKVLLRGVAIFGKDVWQTSHFKFLLEKGGEKELVVRHLRWRDDIGDCHRYKF